ncbi:MAG TPA: hypothetical protein PK610_07435, partial [Flavobacteriales bacterium]|nr:hypothetical protein [Flavobacteriales bacterium]
MLEKFKSAYRFLSSKYQSIHLDYRVNPKPRYGHGNPPHKALYDSINGNRKAYEELLRSFLKYDAQMHTIQDASLEKDQNKPAWNNGFLPGLDIVGIYGMIAEYKPAKYIEIGSGNSTKVARKSITENHLKTEIISIDPFPRAAIDHLADRVIREPFENLSDSRFIVETLNENDI